MRPGGPFWGSLVGFEPGATARQPLDNRETAESSSLHPWTHAAEGVLSDGRAVRAAQEFSFGCIGVLVAVFPLGAALDTSPELARVFEVHVAAGIAKHRGRGLLSVEGSPAVLAGLGLERYVRRRDLMVRKHGSILPSGAARRSRRRSGPLPNAAVSWSG